MSREEQFDFYWKEIFDGLAYNPIEFNTYRFDQSMSLPSKFNKLYEMFKQLALNNQEVMDYLKEFMETFDFKLETTIKDILIVWLNEGLLADVVREAINDEVVEARTDYLGKNYVDLKERLDVERKEVIDSRGGSQTLGERLDSDKAEVATQMAQIVISAVNPISLGLEGITPNIDTDQSGKLQAIIDAAPKNSTIFIPEGRYKLNPKRDNVTITGILLQYAVKMKSNIKVEFRNAEFYCDTQTGRDNYYFILIDGCENVELYGTGTFEGDRLGRVGQSAVQSGEWGHCIAISRASNILIRDGIVITNMFGDGISFRPIKDEHNKISEITIKNISLIGARRNNISVGEGQNIRIINNYFELNGGNILNIAPNAQIDIEEDFALSFVEYEDILISGNRFIVKDETKNLIFTYGVLTYTAFIKNKVERLRIVDNYFENHNRPITLEKCNNSYVENNVMVTSGSYDNAIPDFADIYMIDSTHILVSGNKSKGQPVYGVKARGVNKYIDVLNNQFVDVLCGGMLIPNVEHFTIRGNVFIGCGVTNLECVLRISENSKFGLIIENEFIDNLKSGVQFVSVTDMVISNNIFNQTTLSCIEVRSTSKRISIEGNNVDSYAIGGTGGRFIRSLSTDSIDDIIVRGNRARKGGQSNALYCVDLPSMVAEPNILVIGNDFKDSSTGIETCVPVGKVKNVSNINTVGTLT